MAVIRPTLFRLGATYIACRDRHRIPRAADVLSSDRSRPGENATRDGVFEELRFAQIAVSSSLIRWSIPFMFLAGLGIERLLKAIRILQFQAEGKPVASNKGAAAWGLRRNSGRIISSSWPRSRNRVVLRRDDASRTADRFR